CLVRPVKAAVNNSSIVSPSTPQGTPSTPKGTVLNLAEESCSTWLDYVGPLITDELDSEKCWSYRDPDGNVQGLAAPYLMRRLVGPYLLRRLTAPYLLRRLAAPYLLRRHYTLVIFSIPEVALVTPAISVDHFNMEWFCLNIRS
nr:hypothetical protein CTI12_AA509060 [Tanacetum cinerariifolium]